MLLRSGVSTIRIIDFDEVSLSSLNRRAGATFADVDRPKVTCCAEFFARIAAWARVGPVVEVFHPEDAECLLLTVLDGTHPGHECPEYVLDVIDNIDTKVALLAYCFHQQAPVFSSSGADGKADPSRIRIADITGTTEGPLAASARRRLRAMGITPAAAQTDNFQ